MNETSQLRHACIREFRERSVEKKKTRQDKEARRNENSVGATGKDAPKLGYLED